MKTEPEDLMDWNDERRAQEAARRSSAATGSVTEIVYRWPDGTEEVRYRRPRNTTHALDLIEEVRRLQRAHGAECRYSYRHV